MAETAAGRDEPKTRPSRQPLPHVYIVAAVGEVGHDAEDLTEHDGADATS